MVPTHAYIPGQTARHPEDAFEVIRQTARAGMTPEALAACDAFQVGLRYLETGFYWEAHEVLEPVWIVLTEPCEERQFVQALIQIANARLKIKMGRPKAALRLVMISRDLLDSVESRFPMGVDKDALVGLLDRLEVDVNCAI